MKTKLKYMLLLLLLAACTEDKNRDTKPPTLFPMPQTVAANPGGGYAVNQVTGDTIQPVILESGEILKTGVSIPVVGKTMHLDSVSKPKVAPYMPSNSYYNAHPNAHQIPDNLTVIPINHDSLTTVLLKEIGNNDTMHYLVNRSGDTLQTGIPIPANGKKVKTTQPQPTAALPPIYTHAANTNLQ
ncbi:hypothetical protein N8Z73_00925, partial [bacterium]|nr:hypothetical protein [bacterium]